VNDDGSKISFQILLYKRIRCNSCIMAASLRQFERNRCNCTRETDGPGLLIKPFDNDVFVYLSVLVIQTEVKDFNTSLSYLIEILISNITNIRTFRPSLFHLKCLIHWIAYFTITIIGNTKLSSLYKRISTDNKSHVQRFYPVTNSSQNDTATELASA
jgi:hypothetical protein